MEKSPGLTRDALRLINNILAEKIKIDDREAANSIAVVDAFMNELNPFLKTNFPVYKWLYSREYKTGSSFNDLKISKADEYDINIVLIPPSEFELKVEFFKSNKAFAKIKWSKVKEVPESKKCVLEFFTKKSNFQGYIYPLEVKYWFQGLIDKFCQSNPKIKGIKKFTSAESGPARTIRIDTEQGYLISLDLVPVFTFGFDIFVTNEIPRIFEYPLDQTKAFCSFVPKICDRICEDGRNLSPEDSRLSWRTYIPEIDKKVWYNKLYAKPIVKLLKLLRDQEDWKVIASYHLATVILWEIHDNPSDEYWRGPVLFERFLQALEKLKTYVKERRLPYFLYPQFNLFLYELDVNHALKISNRIHYIVQSLKSDPNNLTKFLVLDK